MNDVVIDYRAYASPRGDLMLEVRFNNERAYLLGPFDNKEQRLVFVKSMTDGELNRQQKFKLTG